MTRKRNICRPITFYNDYIPVMGERNKVEFCAFGTVDGIQVGEALIDDEKHNCMTNRIWEEQMKFYDGLRGYGSAQRIYIVRCEEEEKEREFWEGDQLPFFFFCRIQFGKEKTLLMRDRSVIENGWFDGESDISIRTYLTYDNTDLFIVIRTSKYSKGVEVINALHHSRNFIGEEGHICTLKNSFTVMAVRNRWISNLNDVQKQEWNRDKIEKVYIRLIERSGGDIGQIEKNINIGNKDRWAVLGTDDEMLVLSDVGWGDFLSLYDEQSGVFGDRSEGSVYNLNAAGVTSHICVKLGNRDQDLKMNCIWSPGSQNSKGGRYTKLFGNQVDKLRQKLEEISKWDSNHISELNIILNVLPKYSGEMFNDYVFFPLLKILDTLLELMLKQKELPSQYLDKSSFYDFLAGFCFYTQNTMLTDRHTAQMLGFNVKIYDIPVKLNAFYNAYMYRITSVLNVPEGSDQVDYDFIALPGMADLVRVSELYKGGADNQRLIKVEIPEYSFYNVRGMMIILAHETAHYVGRSMRNRDYRTEAVISSYAHIFIKYIEQCCEFHEDTKDALEECEKRLVNHLYRRLLQEIDEVFIKSVRNSEGQRVEYWNYGAENSLEQNKKLFERLCKRKRDNIDYFAELLPQIHVVMKEIVAGGNLSTVFAPILLKENNSSRSFVVMQQAAWRFITTSKKYTVVASETTLNSLMALYEESFADLMSILILNVGIQEYVTGMIEYAEYQNMHLDMLLDSECILRIAVVLGCILASESLVIGNVSIYDEWKSVLQKCKGIAKWEKVVQKAMSLWDDTRSSSINKRPYKDNVYHAFKHDVVIPKRAAEYLKICMKQFAEYCKDDFEKKVSELRKLFWIFSPKAEISAEQQIVEIVDYVDDYKKDLLKKMMAEETVDGDSEC